MITFLIGFVFGAMVAHLIILIKESVEKPFKYKCASPMCSFEVASNDPKLTFDMRNTHVKMNHGDN